MRFLWLPPLTGLYISILAVGLSACGGPPDIPLGEDSSAEPAAPAAPAASIKINNGAKATNSLNVVVNISAGDYDEMYITYDPSCEDLGTWEPRSSNKNWTLVSANTTNAVAAKFRIAASGVESKCLRATIKHDDTPPNFLILSPAPGDFVTAANQSSVTLSGACDEIGTALITSPVTAEVNCGLVPWTLDVDLSAAPEGAIDITVAARDAAGNTSAPVTFPIIKDTHPPQSASFQINNGATFTASTSVTFHFSAIGATEMKISPGAECQAGDWENYATSQAAVLALSNAVNTYSAMFRDQAENTTACLVASITHDSTAPVVTIAAPADGTSINAVNASSVAFNGACSEEGAIVTLTGSLSDTAPCIGGAWSRTINLAALADGNLTVTARQTDTSGLQGQQSITLPKDTQAPANVSVTSPSENPYQSGGSLTLSGACESGATVQLTGSSTQNTTCANSAYSFNFNPGGDATYNFSLRQQDPAGNQSGSVSFQWIRNSTVVNPPTISSPASSPFASNGGSVTISGSCDNGNDVKLTGDVTPGEVTSPAGNLTVACAGGAYSFTVAKGSDGSYTFHLRQWQGAAYSSATSVVWNRDATAPNTTLVTTPGSVNVHPSATFTFTSNEAGSTFQCSLNGGAFSTCTSPHVISGLANNGHTFAVRAIDAVGNVDQTPADASWTQTAYGTIALFPFDAGDPLADTSLHDVSMKSPLTNSGSTNEVAGKYDEAQDFDANTPASASASHVETHRTGREEMTLDLWVRFASLPGSDGSRMHLINKDGGSGVRGWQFSFKRLSAGNFVMSFAASTNGVTMTEVQSTAADYDIGTWYHLTVTWDRGNVKFYLDGVAIGTGTIGSAGSATVFDSSAALRLGNANDMTNAEPLDALLDDVRWSRVVRWSNDFTPPNAAVTAD